MLLKFPVKKEAKIIDISQGIGAQLWQQFKANGGRGEDEFAEIYGADILLYPYGVQAFVVKNSAILGNANGVHRELLKLEDLFHRAKNIRDPRDLMTLIQINRLRPDEAAEAITTSGVSLQSFQNYALKCALKDLPLVLKILKMKNISQKDEIAIFKKRIGKQTALEWAHSLVAADAVELLDQVGIVSELVLAKPATAQQVQKFLLKIMHWEIGKLLEHVLVYPGWEKQEGLIEAFLDEKKFEQWRPTLVKVMLSKEEWQQSPKFLAWVEKLFVIFPQEKLKDLCEIYWAAPESSAKAVLFQKLVAKQNPAINSALLKTALTQKKPVPPHLIKQLFGDQDPLQWLMAREKAREWQFLLNIEDVSALFPDEPLNQQELEKLLRKLHAAGWNEMRSFLEYVVKLPGMEKKPEIVDTILRIPELHEYLHSLVIYDLSKTHWQKSPKILQWVQQLVEVRDLEEFIDDVALILKKLPQSQEKIHLIERLIKKENFRINLALVREEVLRDLDPQVQKPLLELILKHISAKESPLFPEKFLQHVLQYQPWNKEMTWIKTILRIKAGYGGSVYTDYSLAAALTEFFAENYFPGHPEYLESVLAMEPGKIGFDAIPKLLQTWNEEPSLKKMRQGGSLSLEQIKTYFENRKKAALCGATLEKIGIP